eukprot:7444843-Alexandrium_andersonii.AAC.1
MAGAICRVATAIKETHKGLENRVLYHPLLQVSASPSAPQLAKWSASASRSRYMRVNPRSCGVPWASLPMLPAIARASRAVCLKRKR